MFGGEGEENRGEEENCAVGRRVERKRLQLVLNDLYGLELAPPSYRHNIWVLRSTRECGVKLWMLAHTGQPSRKPGTPGNAI